MAHQSWNGWKFQIYWKKIEWFNPRISSKGNNIFCVSFQIYFLKDNNKSSHQVGNLKLKPLDLEVSYNKNIIINKLEVGLTGTRIEWSDSGKKYK